ncbi:capsule biosynthesis protein [Chthonobacter rhizosphaerae]|uniref:capsule biosynthesis protein n=1 Tax=Chthonobacter rhizosphaerae TaxID=2735553 RepID=UPI0015EF689B|nr:capsular biosynthesis protein [Chthonobacter rhizosphaerae]
MTAPPRTVLFLQGPASPFMARVGAEVAAAGHQVRRINLAVSDELCWRLPGAVSFRGRFEDWRPFVADHLAREGVTDLALLGDCRAYQAVAIEEAHRRGIRVHAVEHGYFRPDWLTVERDGMSTFSHVPRDPDAIRALAPGLPDPTVEPIAEASFLTYAVWDVIANIGNVVLNPVAYCHYRHHAIYHPLVEYGGWLLKFALAGTERRHRDRVLKAMAASGRPFWLVPLQLATDYQIRVHSPFPHLTDAVRWIVRSFARNAPAGDDLLFKIHPLDNALAFWRRRIAREARAAGVEGRVHVIDGGDLDALLRITRGVVTVNSTVGIAALREGAPLIALGNAVFDVPGLAFEGPLARFWREAQAPDPELARDFLRVLAHTTQVRGGFTAERAMAIGAANVAARILEEGERLPRIAPQDRSNPPYRRLAEWSAERDLP